MAIISSVPGVEVEVRVNGERAEEYMDSNQDDSDNKAIRYIEAISGARFTIHCTISSSCDRQGKDIYVKIILDGEKIKGMVLFLNDSKEGDEHSTDISDGTMQEKVMSMGVISIQLHRGLAIAKQGTPRNRTITMNKIGKVPEKALKGKPLSHQVQPFAEFIYQYRSKTALQAEGVIPRTPSPIPLEDRPLEELNPEELRELLRRSREKIAAATAVKNESESEVKSEVKSEDNASANGPKRAHDRSELEFVEARPVKRQRTSGSAPVIIDLSDD
ncbi:hypothetical protein SLS54_005159 [Diplodia seriata]